MHVQLDLRACQSACLLVALVVMCFLFSVLCFLFFFFSYVRGGPGGGRECSIGGPIDDA